MKRPHVFSFILEKSTFKYHLSHSIAPGSVNDLIANIINIINNVGIIILHAFSIPFSSPFAEISPIIIAHASVNMLTRPVFDVKTKLLLHHYTIFYLTSKTHLIYK